MYYLLEGYRSAISVSHNSQSMTPRALHTLATVLLKTLPLYQIKVSYCHIITVIWQPEKYLQSISGSKKYFFSKLKGQWNNKSYHDFES